MKVRFTYLRFPADKVEEAKQVYHTEIAPVIRGYQGNKDVLFLQAESDQHQFISCSMWESANDLKAFEESQEYRQVIGRIKALAEKAEQQYYEVIQ